MKKIIFVLIGISILSIMVYATPIKDITAYPTLYSPAVPFGANEQLDIYGISMCPVLVEGYTVTCVKMPFNQIREGHIIFWKQNINQNCRDFRNCMVHRVVNVTENGVITKADNPYATNDTDGLIIREQYYCTVQAVEYTGEYKGDCKNYDYGAWFE